MRRIYAERQAHLLVEAARLLNDHLTIHLAEAGMHLIGILKEEYDAYLLSQRALRQQLIIPAMADYNIASAHPNTILLGYTAVTKQEISDGIQRLATLFGQRS